MERVSTWSNPVKKLSKPDNPTHAKPLQAQARRREAHLKQAAGYCSNIRDTQYFSFAESRRFADLDFIAFRFTRSSVIDLDNRAAKTPLPSFFAAMVVGFSVCFFL